MAQDQIRLLGISGSPRLASTDFVIREALKYAEEKYNALTDYFSVAKKTIMFCIHCDYCLKRKGCVHKDDMHEVYQKLEWADALLLGSPVYQGNVSGQLKALMDRCRAVVAQDMTFFTNKVGAALAVGGDRIGGQEPTLRTIHDFYIINEAFSVGGGAFGANLGATIWSRDKGAAGAEADKLGLKTLYRTVDRLITTTQRLKPKD